MPDSTPDQPRVPASDPIEEGNFDEQTLWLTWRGSELIYAVVETPTFQNPDSPRMSLASRIVFLMLDEVSDVQRIALIHRLSEEIEPGPAHHAQTMFRLDDDEMGEIETFEDLDALFADLTEGDDDPGPADLDEFAGEAYPEELLSEEEGDADPETNHDLAAAEALMSRLAEPLIAQGLEREKLVEVVRDATGIELTIQDVPLARVPALQQLLRWLAGQEDRFSDLVWYARSDPDRPEGAAARARIEMMYTNDVETYFERPDWQHGFNSGALAAFRAVLTALIGGSVLDAVEMFPQLDT